MAQPTTIRVMLSSRCNDAIEFKRKHATLSDLRKQLKVELEKELLFDTRLYDVWINEDAPPNEGSSDSWEACLKQVKLADLVVVLYNGNAGWAKGKGEVGICHAELEEALSTAPAKVTLVEISPLQPLGSGAVRARNERFRKYVDTQNLFRGQVCGSGEDVIARVKQALRESTADMVRLGGREARKERFDRGTALDWTRLNFSQRRSQIVEVLRSALKERVDTVERDEALVVRFDNAKVLVVCDAIPASVSLAAARELVGQPFLRDHLLSQMLSSEIGGPIHIIGCHRGITEGQAIRQLGFPDAEVVSTSFGLYVADQIQKIQLVFLTECRDETATRYNIQRLFEWLGQTKEEELLVQRAASRAKIVSTIASEWAGEGKGAGSKVSRQRGLRGIPRDL